MLLNLNRPLSLTYAQLCEYEILRGQGLSETELSAQVLGWDYENSAGRNADPSVSSAYGLRILTMVGFQRRFSNGRPLPAPALALLGVLDMVSGGSAEEPLSEKQLRDREQVIVEAAAVVLVEIYMEDNWKQKTAYAQIADLLLTAGFRRVKGHVKNQYVDGVENWWKESKTWPNKCPRGRAYTKITSMIRDAKLNNYESAVVLEKFIRMMSARRKSAMN